MLNPLLLGHRRIISDNKALFNLDLIQYNFFSKETFGEKNY